MSTRWSPDTCKCVIDLSYEGGTEHAAMVAPCPRHAHLSVTDVLAECRRKNYAIGEVMDLMPEAQKKAVRWSIVDDQVHIHLPVRPRGKSINFADIAKKHGVVIK